MWLMVNNQYLQETISKQTLRWVLRHGPDYIWGCPERNDLGVRILNFGTGENKTSKTQTKYLHADQVE